MVGLFSYYRYILNENTYGQFKAEEIEDYFETRTLEEFYEERDLIRMESVKRKKAKEKKKESKIDKLNREFNQNYC